MIIIHQPNGGVLIETTPISAARFMPDETFLYWCGELPPNYPMPAIRTEVDYLYLWPTNEAIACVMYNVSDPVTQCVYFYPSL